jgi:ElaB/YqjD/DUF883 family membrane-anchored ribosome-binding protein
MGASTARSGDRYAKVKAEAGKLKDQAGGKARSAAEEGKMKAAETLGSVSRATREAAEKMRGSQADPLAGYVSGAADAIDSFARRMNEKSIEEMVDDAREIVRRSPVLFIGIAAGVGFLLSRFLKATSREGGHGRGYSRAGAGDELDSGEIGAMTTSRPEGTSPSYHA